MKIAQIAPLYESVPPQLYGGTERVVSYLTEELVARGHDVTLYASGDSCTSARLRSVCERALRLEDGPISSPIAPHLLQAEILAQQAAEYDIVHSHADFLLFPQIRHRAIPAVTTMHGRLDMPDMFSLFREFSDMRLVSISEAQRNPMPWANWTATVYHGIPESLYSPCYGEGDYLAFLGRISPEKGLPCAIEIAQRAGMPLRIAAKVDTADKEYFEQVIQPLLKQPHVEFLGEIGEDHKGEFLGKARAVLFPINWPEPFGLVMIESMACGTPVIAFPCGSVEEIVQDGITGFVVKDVEAAAEAVKRIPQISRSRCRTIFEERFSVRRMCDDYLKVYEQVIEEHARGALSGAGCIAGGE